MRSETRITAEERVRDDYPRVTAQCLVSLCRRVVGHAEDGFCMKWRPHRPAHSSTREQAAEAVRCWRPAWLARPPRRDLHRNHPRLPARRGNGGNGAVRGFRGAFLSGGGCGGLLPGVAWSRLLPRCAGKTASGGAPPRHAGQPAAPGPEGR